VKWWPREKTGRRVKRWPREMCSFRLPHAKILGPQAGLPRPCRRIFRGAPWVPSAEFAPPWRAVSAWMTCAAPIQRTRPDKRPGISTEVCLTRCTPVSRRQCHIRGARGPDVSKWVMMLPFIITGSRCLEMGSRPSRSHTFVRAPARAARAALGEVSAERGCGGHFRPGSPQAVVWERANGR
jgi:hypothetical protein